MAILHPLPAGTILLCNYDSGFRPPEMVKKRPCIIISPRLPHREQLCTVVPLSTTRPLRETTYQLKIDLDLPPPWGQDQLKAIRVAVLTALGLDTLTPHL